MKTLFQLACCWLVMASWMASAVFAQSNTYTVRTVVPQTMWTETYRSGPYTNDEQIRDVITNPAKYLRHSCPIRISSKTFNEYYEFFKQNEKDIRSLLVLGATNDDLEKLSTLDSLLSLDLPVCEADDFRPLARLNKLIVLYISNPNLQQFRQEELLGQLEALRGLTLYNVADLQAALELPGLDPAASLEQKGLMRLTIQSPQLNPCIRVNWPEKLEPLHEFSVVGERIFFSYVHGRRANIIIGRYRSDARTICTTLLRDVIEKSGFYDRRKVIDVDLESRYVVPDGSYAVEYDLTDISPLKAFSDLKYLTLTGDFYGFEHLTNVPLQSIYITEMSPFPSQQALEAMSKHPTLKKVTKVIESATEKVLWQREG